MNKNQNILIIGAGQIGSRYIQGIVPLLDNIQLFVVDTKKESLERSDLRLKEITQINLDKVSYFNNLDQISNEKIEIVIISSTATGRGELIAKVLSKFKPKYWIIEKVLEQSIAEIERIEKHLNLIKGNVWVNHPRRIMKFHNNLKPKIIKLKENYGSLDFLYDGFNWGLGCNALHFIDLISWWINERPENIIDCNLDEWLPSKRIGFYEPYGNLKVKYSDGSTLSLKCMAKGQEKENISLKIYKKEILKVKIYEYEGKAFFIDDELINGKYELQSQLTENLLKNILKNGFCNLTPLEESILQHKLFIKTLSNSWSRFKNNPVYNFAPIT